MSKTIAPNLKRTLDECDFSASREGEERQAKSRRGDSSPEKCGRKSASGGDNGKRITASDNEHNSLITNDIIVESLKKIRELELELLDLDNRGAEDNSDDDDDEFSDESDSDLERLEEEVYMIGGREAESMGYAICAKETLKFLYAQGYRADNPLIVNLRKRLIGNAGNLN